MIDCKPDLCSGITLATFQSVGTIPDLWNFHAMIRDLQARRYWGQGGNAPPIICQTCFGRCYKPSLIWQQLWQQFILTIHAPPPIPIQLSTGLETSSYPSRLAKQCCGYLTHTILQCRRPPSLHWLALFYQSFVRDITCSTTEIIYTFINHKGRYRFPNYFHWWATYTHIGYIVGPGLGVLPTSQHETLDNSFYMGLINNVRPCTPSTTKHSEALPLCIAKYHNIMMYSISTRINWNLLNMTCYTPQFSPSDSTSNSYIHTSTVVQSLVTYTVTSSSHATTQYRH